MIRVLVMIAVAGFLVSVVTLSTAISIGGTDLLTDGFWNAGGHFGWNWDDDDHHGRHHGDDGAQTTRDMAWTGGDSLRIDVPAEVTYTQGPTAKMTISGPQREVDDLVIEDGALRFSHHHHHGRDGDLVVTMTAPGVTHFGIDGSGRLAIEGYKQDRLGLDITGDAEVTVKGETKSLGLDLSGSGVSDLSGLKLADANVNVEGSGQTTIAPTGAVNIQISGSGEVTLLSRPSKLESNITGSGAIHQQDGGPPAPPAPPEPPKPPRPPKTTT